MPFGESISSSYGTTPSSSGGAKERGNRRHRTQNGGGAGFVSPNFDEFPFAGGPPYSELPFSSLRRKNRHHSSKVVQWAMRGVLASPVIVLVLWSLGTFLFSSHHHGTSHAVTSSRMMSSTARGKSGGTRTNARRSTNNNAVPKVAYMTPQMQQQQQQQVYSNNVETPALLANTNSYTNVQQQEQQRYMLGNQQQQQVVQANLPQTQMIPMVAPMGSTQQAAVSSVVVPPPQQQQQQLPVAVDSNALQQQQQQVLQPVMSQAASPVVVEPALQQQQQQQQTQPIAQLAVESQPQLQQQVQPMAQLSASSSGAAATEAQPAMMQSNQQQQPFVLYYDPKESTGNGLPAAVYDAQGNTVQWELLQGKQLFFEPVVQQQQQLPSAQMVSPTSVKKWGESTAQDQNIIVATVAVMALLVGALSARRMRSRSFLASCIENENLEDDVAYDAAYTTTDSSYNTFGGWKGDLEKFDV